MGNNKISSQLRKTFTQPQRGEYTPSTSKRARRAGGHTADVGAGDPAVDILTHIARHSAPTGHGRRPQLSNASLMQVGVAALLWTSGTHGRALLANHVGPVPAPANWLPEVPSSAPVAGPAPAYTPAPAPPPPPYNPFVVARATQNADLMRTTANATVFNRDADGNIVIKPTDVHQDIDHEGDCQTLSVMASVAHKNKTLIVDHLQELGIDDKGERKFAIKVAVDDAWTTQIVGDADLPGTGALQKTDVIWPRLYEQAIIQAYPGDDVLNKHLVDASQPSSGRWPIDTGKVLHAMTNLRLQEGSGDAAIDDLNIAVANGSAATAGVNDGQLNWFGSFKTVHAQTGEEVDASHPDAVTILGSHQYAVLDVAGNSTVGTVRLFNPYNYPGNGGNTFNVSASVFRQFFHIGCAWT